MGDEVLNIPLANLLFAFAPVALVLVILARWSLGARTASYALVRMLGQLLLIGYLLTYIFAADYAGIVVAVLLVMVFASSWIALRTVSEDRGQLYLVSLLSIAVGGGLTLFVTSIGVLSIEPWYLPRFLVPLAGMSFANAMNAVSLAADRMQAELTRGTPWPKARNIAMNSAMIPNINMLFAVGLVSLPGMMTGQILSGVSPLIAVRYQIMVMCMIFAAAGLSTALFLVLTREHRWSRAAEQETP